MTKYLEGKRFAYMYRYVTLYYFVLSPSQSVLSDLHCLSVLPLLQQTLFM